MVWEAQLRQAEAVPATTKVIALSVDGVMAPLRGSNQAEKGTQPGKHASGPNGYKEVGCGTVTLYDPEAERLQTVRYASALAPGAQIEARVARGSMRATVTEVFATGKPASVPKKKAKPGK